MLRRLRAQVEYAEKQAAAARAELETEQSRGASRAVTEREHRELREKVGIRLRGRCKTLMCRAGHVKWVLVFCLVVNARAPRGA